MATEIERKFLVHQHKLPALNRGTRIVQGYIPTQSNATVRVRLKGERSFLTLKGASVGASRPEFEYEIPVADAREMLSLLCSGPKVEKTRYEIRHANHIWELDIFEGANRGLIVAEVELADERERVALPEWIADEVTGDARYYNSNLLEHPFCSW